MAYGTVDACSFVSMARCCFLGIFSTCISGCLSFLPVRGHNEEQRLLPGVIIKPLCIGMSRFDLRLLHLSVGFVFLGFRQDASLVVLVLNAHQVLK
jgi:hypothetical protein